MKEVFIRKNVLGINELVDFKSGCVIVKAKSASKLAAYILVNNYTLVSQ